MVAQQSCQEGLTALESRLDPVEVPDLGYGWVNRVRLPEDKSIRNEAGVHPRTFMDHYRGLVDQLEGRLPTVNQVLTKCPRARLVQEAYRTFMVETATRLTRRDPGLEAQHVIVVTHGPGLVLPAHPFRITTIPGSSKAVRYQVNVDPFEDKIRIVDARHLNIP